MEQIHTIVTHRFPHLDEIFGIWLLQNQGGDKFPGIENAQIEYWDGGGSTPDGHPVEEWEQKGYVMVGVGGGRFDEHSTTTKDRKGGDCAATLVAKYLEVDKEPWMKQVLDFVVRDDLQGSASPFDLGPICKLLHQQYPNEPGVAMDWVMTGIGAKIREQINLWREARKEYESKARIERVIGPKGKELVIAVICSDNPQIGKYARMREGGNANIVIQQTSAGNVQIFTDNRGLTLYDVVQMIRLAEQEKNRADMSMDWRTLALEGKVKGAEEWYFQEAGQMLLNGSLTANGVPPTKLTLNHIVELVKIGVSPSTFEPVRAETCRQGVCVSSRQNSCPWYIWGLHRCREIRFQYHNSR